MTNSQKIATFDGLVEAIKLTGKIHYAKHKQALKLRDFGTADIAYNCARTCYKLLENLKINTPVNN